MPKTISDPSNTTNQNIVREIAERVTMIRPVCKDLDYLAGFSDFRSTVLEILEDYERPRKTSE